MTLTANLDGKPVAVELSTAAARALARRTRPLMAEIHLIFGCMVAKRVWFTEKLRPDAVPVAQGLSFCFRPVRYERSCRIEGIDKGEASPDYPVVGPRRRFVPDIVFIDYRAGEWVGDFTYDRDAAARLHATGSARPAIAQQQADAVPASAV
jgi:hypothetical protein